MKLYDFNARQLDPQIRRFTAIGPFDQFSSGYIALGHDPANMIDPDSIVWFVGLLDMGN